MALFCQNMLEIAVELAQERPAYIHMCLKFTEHFLWIASSMLHAGEDTGMWDEEDGFFYDVLRLPDGRAQRLNVRSMVGLLPLSAVTVFEGGCSSMGAGEPFSRFRRGVAGPGAWLAAAGDSRSGSGRGFRGCPSSSAGRG